MWLESYIAEEEEICSREYAEQVRSLISVAEPKIPSFPNAREGVKYALLDKKNEGKSNVSLILPKARGEYAELILPAEKYEKYLERL